MTEALRAQHLHVTRGARPVVRDVGLSAHYGSVLAIVGPNGAGKSSLVKALAGLLPFSGTVHVDGRELTKLSPTERARRIAWVPQQSSMQADLSVAELVGHGRFSHGSRWFRRAAPLDPVVQRALRVTDVAHLKHRAFNRLSGGEQRRALIARALATEARILLLDEPTAGLDVAHVLRTHALLRELARAGHAVVCVLHDLGDVERHADQVALLVRGEVAAFGAPERALSERRLEQVYGVRRSEETVARFLLAEAAT